MFRLLFKIFAILEETVAMILELFEEPEEKSAFREDGWIKCLCNYCWKSELLVGKKLECTTSWRQLLLLVEFRETWKPFSNLTEPFAMLSCPDFFLIKYLREQMWRKRCDLGIRGDVVVEQGECVDWCVRGRRRDVAVQGRKSLILSRRMDSARFPESHSFHFSRILFVDIIPYRSWLLCKIINI